MNTPVKYSISTARPPRWLTRILAFTTILSFGIFTVTSPKHLERLLDAAFDGPASRDAREDSSDFRRIPYHVHLRAAERANGTSPSVRISFELHDPKTVPLTNVFNPYIKCPLGKVTSGKQNHPTGEFRKGQLPPSLLRVDGVRDARGLPRSGRVLDFTTTLSTSLRLLLIGDSVMVQLAQAFDEMAGGVGVREIVWDAWHGHNGGTVVAPTRGGGASALWRMTALLSMGRKGKPPANSFGGGWSDKEINALTGFSYRRGNASIGGFDALVFRVMHGWMKLHEITRARLVEAVELSHELLGATVVVLMTVPFTNNVKTVEEMARVREINGVIRDIARGWHRREDAGVRHVLVLEYGSYYNHIIWSNALHLGYNVTPPLDAVDAEGIFDVEGPSFLLDRLQDAGEWPPSIPMVCSDMSSLGSHRHTCNRNYLFSDGMHTCPETLASRYAAGLACLLGCAFNGKEGDVSDGAGNRSRHGLSPEDERVRTCEMECNEQFLSVLPVEESWIDRGVTLASFSG